MASFTKFNSFVEAVAEKIHNLGSDTLKVALTNTLPSAAYTQLSQITEIAYTNLSSRSLVRASSAQSGGTYKLVIDDLTLTSSGGTTGPFRYIVIYNDTATNDELICYSDYGAAIILADGSPFVIDLDNVNGLLSLV